jgi:hypothetical protein
MGKGEHGIQLLSLVLVGRVARLMQLRKNDLLDAREVKGGWSLGKGDFLGRHRPLVNWGC